MANAVKPLGAKDAPVACWRFIPSTRGGWQHGTLTHDPDLDGWMWEDTEPEDAPRDALRAYWTPPLLDAHTHLGDAFLRPSRDNLPRSIHALVAPPHGVKHQELAKADPAHVQKAIHERAKAMVANGTKAALDFREAGAPGLKTLLSACEGTGLDAHPLARPAADPQDKNAWTQEAKHLLLGPTFGLGLSGIRDLPQGRLEDAAEACKRRGKSLALHLSEARHESVEDALRYEPRILVHLVYTRNEEWTHLLDSPVLTVTCPTSNRFFGMKAPLQPLYENHREHALPTAVGTDNAMLGDGDLRDEARLIAEDLPNGDLDWLLRSLSWTPWRHLNLGPDPHHPGLLWGLDPKGPTSHPEDTPLSQTQTLWSTPPRRAPPLGANH